jgi:hypothetical protein
MQTNPLLRCDILVIFVDFALLFYFDKIIS